MATVFEALRGINAYPVPLRTYLTIEQRRGLVLDNEATHGVLVSKNYRLAVADLLIWLSNAPSISQGGQTYSFNEEQRKQLRCQANEIYMEAGVKPSAGATYGYKGSRL